MVIDEGQRLRMVRRFEEVFGSEVTESLMSYLPPGGWAEVATKGDLGELRGEMAELRADVKGEIGELRAVIFRDNRALFLGLAGLVLAYGTALVAAVRLH